MSTSAKLTPSQKLVAEEKPVAFIGTYHGQPRDVRLSEDKDISEIKFQAARTRTGIVVEGTALAFRGVEHVATHRQINGHGEYINEKTGAKFITLKVPGKYILGMYTEEQCAKHGYVPASVDEKTMDKLSTVGVC